MYTDAQETVLRNASPVTYDEAKVLATQLGQTLKSVISKLQSMELVYIKKVVPAPKPAQATKAELVEAFEAVVGATFPGLIGATRTALVELLANAEAQRDAASD